MGPGAKKKGKKEKLSQALRFPFFLFGERKTVGLRERREKKRFASADMPQMSKCTRLIQKIGAELSEKGTAQ
jgi:hypothetical protein